MTDSNPLVSINIDSIQSIENRTERINLLHNSILLMQINTFEYGVMIGKELSEQKAELPHGHFIKWIEKNIPSISRMTANNYMRVFENQDYLREKLAEKLELNLAYKELGKKQKAINPQNKMDTIKSKIDNHLLDSIKLHKQKVSIARKKLLKGQPIKKSEKAILKKDTTERKKKIVSSIEKVKVSIEKSQAKIIKKQSTLEKLEILLNKIEM
jgi:hypothetical protein